MARQPLRFTRGNNAQTGNYTGGTGEPVFNTDTKRVHIQDGQTQGGIPLAGLGDVADTVKMSSALADYAAPLQQARRRNITSKISDFGYTPYDYILSETDRDKVRLGAPDAPAVDYAFRAFFADLVAQAGNTGIRAYIPPGVYVFDSVVEVILFSLGVNQRKYCLDIAPGAKFVHSASNRYRFVVQGTWDATANPGLISSMSGNVGDAYVAITANDNLNVDLVKSVNVGDHVYRGVNGWQKILCKADYHMQYLDASTNLDSQGNQVVFAGQGREGETYIVGQSGTLNIDGLGALKVGDEIIHIWGAWRKKTIRGGNFRGYWKPSTNVLYSDEAGIGIIPGSIGLSNDPGAPNNAGGTTGDYYIVIGTRGFNNINLGDNYVTCLGESSFWGQGQKVWCRSPGKWHKAFASPTPRGRWNPASDTYSAHYYPATHPSAVVTTQTAVPAVYSDNYNLGSAGEYGGTYEVTFPGRGTVNGITRDWQRGEYIFYGPNGFEFIPRDPSYDRGIFLFHQDEVTCLHIHGTMNLISRDTSGLEGGYSAGTAVRAWSNKRAGVNNYAFGAPMFWIKGTLYSESDAADVGDALGRGGIWEQIVEVKNLYLPTIDKYHVRAPASPAATRKQQLRRYPRTTVCAIHYVDGYVPAVLEGNINGGFLDKIRFDSDCFDQDQYSYEGGVVGPLDGASGMTSVYVNRGWRETVAGWRSTMTINLRDDLFGEAGVKIKGTWGVRVKLDRVILPGGFSGAPEFFDDRPAAVLLEDCASISIDAGIPASGNILSATQYASVLRTRGGVCDISLQGDFGQMDGGVILDLHHNGNDERFPFYWGTPQQYLPNEPGRNIKVTLKSSTGLEPRRNREILRGNGQLFRGPTIRGPVTFTDGVTLPRATVVSDTNAIVELTATAAPTNAYSTKQIFSSVAVGGGNAWLFRAVRASDGAIRDAILVDDGTILTSSTTNVPMTFTGLTVKGTSSLSGPVGIRQDTGAIVEIGSTNGGANTETLLFRTSFSGTAGDKTTGRILAAPDAGTGGRLTLDTMGPDGTLRRAIHADAFQNVGIGLSSPGVRLDVAGPIRPGSYTVATLPAGAVGALIYVSNGRKVGEASGAGTGVIVCYSNGAWRRLSDDSPIAA